MEEDLYDPESSFLPTITLYTGILGISLFSWSFYNYSGFRRNVIQKTFNACDYCYDIFHKLWYDEKIRINDINKNYINIKDIHQPFLNKFLDDLTISNNLESNSSSISSMNNQENEKENESSELELVEDLDKMETVETIEELIEEQNYEASDECSQKTEEDGELLDFIKKYDYDHHGHILHKFLTNDINFKSIHIKENTYYLLCPNLLENNINHDFKNEHILEIPWLAVSLIISTIDDELKEYDITSSLKKFWIENNNLPVHLEYYVFWVDILLNEAGISNKNIIPRDKIKDINLTIIDEVGEFINYKNVLIVPRKDNFKIIEFPSHE